MRTKLSLIFCLMLSLMISFAANAKKPDSSDDGSNGNVPPGQPFQALQEQIDQLKAQLTVLQFNKLAIELGPETTISDPLPLPVSHGSVRIEVTLRYKKDDGSTSFPDLPTDYSNIMYAVVYRNPTDSGTIHLSWIGTDNDGATNSGNVPFGVSAPIATIYNIVNETKTGLASLIASEDGSVRLVQNTDLTGRYVVKLWY